MRTLSSLIGRAIVTDQGRSLGHCHDVRGELTSTSLRVTGLVVGGRGRLEHFGLGARASATPERISEKDVVPWTAIVRFEGDRIIVREDAEASEY
jgi:sporulation protein YlmC with PRC-barrel domain